MGVIRRVLWRVLPLLLVLAGLLVFVLWRGLNLWMDTPLRLPAEGLVYEVPAGSHVRAVFADLQQRGHVQNAQPLRWYLRFSRKAAPVQAGEYALASGSTPRSLLQQFADGQVVQYSLTIPEGWNLRQVWAALRAEPRLRHTLDSLDAVPALLGLEPGESAEGWLFPDTYRFHKGMSDAELLMQAHQRMLTVLERQWRQRSEGLPIQTPYEALILASLIEKETGVVEERPTIAGVFVRRLQKGMRLQTDPTVIYGQGDAFDGNLTRAHLREPNPYNTYLNAGLPPTPIALPGEAAIHAALNPEAGDSLFFVARGDGSHVFSVTLAEHEAAVQHYQVRNRAQQYRSRPPSPEAAP